jgi:beta-1,4-mannosyltransferase
MAEGSVGPERLVVMSSLRAVRPTTNPYVIELNERLAARVAVELFSWRRFLLGSWDVLHVHWPEVLVRRRTASRTWLASALLRLGLRRARRTGRVVIRTVHNLEPHEGQSRAVRRALDAVDRATGGWVVLNARTPTPGPGPVAVIPHGTYTQWYAGAPEPAAVPGRVAYVGLVRPYKGVDDLVRAFRSTRDERLTLHVCGQVQDTAIADALRALAGDDPRITLDLRHLPDEDLAREVREAELVVLPYRAMHNSGAALLALSLGRPVLVPRNPVTDDLAAEVGPEWVQRLEGVLDGDVLVDAWSRVQGIAGAPDLGARDWDEIADAHVRFFTDLVGGQEAARASLPASGAASGADVDRRR